MIFITRECCSCDVFVLIISSCTQYKQVRVKLNLEKLENLQNLQSRLSAYKAGWDKWFVHTCLQQLFWTKEGRKEMFYLMTHSTHLRLYDIRHMVKDHSLREETSWCHLGYSFWLAARVLLYASSHRQDSTYHWLGALAGMRNSSMGPPWRINLTTHFHHEQTLIPWGLYITPRNWTLNYLFMKPTLNLLHWFLFTIPSYCYFIFWLFSLFSFKSNDLNS